MSDAPRNLRATGDLARSPERVPSLPATIEELEKRAEAYFRSARAENTVKAYAHDLQDFATWCKVDAGGLSPLPATPRTVALYITDVAGRGLKAATIQRRLAAIAQLHQEANLDDPTKTKAVRNTYRGIVREIGSFQEGKAPILAPTARRILGRFAHERSPTAIRDRALILVGLAGGYRVSELASLLAEDIEFEDRGAVILLRRSKTDKVGGGSYQGIPYGHHDETCPVTHLRVWLSVLGVDEGPLFRAVDRHGNVKDRPMASDSISRVVKKRAKEAGLDPTRYSGHSLRAWLVTGASEGGAHDRSIMDQTRHRSVATLNRYRRRSGLFDNNAAFYLGL
jgi:site-specific recombinase XerD